MSALLLENHDHLDERQLQLAVRRLADSLEFGGESSPFIGSGIDYMQSRPYQAGDPIKSIDWKVSARTQRYYIKEYESLKRIPVYIILDTSASMALRSGPLSKYSVGLQIAGGLALAALSRMNPVGFMTGGSRALHYRPALARSQVWLWMQQLRMVSLDEGTALATALREVGLQLRERSVIGILTDGHDPDVYEALPIIAHKHDCFALHLHDPIESTPAHAGFMRLREAEHDRHFVAHGGHQFTDPDLFEDTCHERGVDYCRINLGEPYLAHLREFLRRRDQRRR